MSFKSFLNFISYFCLFLFFSSFSAWAEPREGHVGEIRYSILNVEQFQKLYGSEWELMEGQSLDSCSRLRDLWGSEKIPDARGVFLRSMNQRRATSEGNPMGELSIGTYQKDEFRLHNHGGGDHAHSYTGGNAGGTLFGNHTQSVHNYGVLPQFSSHSGQIIYPEGGIETRPRCILVNTFIKVRETPQAQNAQEILPEKIRIITQHPDFEAAVSASVRKILQQIH